MSQTPRLQMRDVAKAFGPVQALDGVWLEVHAGEVHALIGENGAGKSTLMKALAGAHPVDRGQMLLDGLPYTPSSPAHGRRAGIGMIYQELSLAEHLSVAENIALGTEPRKGLMLDWNQMRRTATGAMAKVGRPDVKPDTIVGQLTPAQQQLVEIARAMAVGARVLVLDEPSSSLAREDVQRLFELIAQLRDQGMAIVYISHFLEEVRTVCDRFTVLRDGQSVGSGVVADTSVEQIVKMMVGRSVDELYPRTQRSAGEVLLHLNDLAGVKLPRSASLSLHRGEVVGIAGVVGAGRTEMLRAIFGLDPVVSGEVRIAQISGARQPPQRWRDGVGMLSEDRRREGLAMNLSIADNLTLASMSGLGPRGLVLPGRQQTACKPWIERIPIRCRDARQPVGALSGGNQQKVALARLLHADVDVLLLDEPTRGIDVGSKAQIYKLIDQLAQQGKAVLMVSSYLPELLGTADRIAVMCRGELGQARPVEQCTEHSLMLEATGATNI